MRIRKNAQLASRGYFPNRQVHVCQLNQSRWDATNFGAESEDTRPDPYSPQPHFDGDYSYAGNGSLGDSIGAVESSAASMIDSEENNVVSYDMGISFMVDENDELEDNEEVKFRVEETFPRPNGFKKGKRIAEKQAGLRRRGRPKLAKRGGAPAPASNPYEFYYYSGFGPSWGKRRGEKGFCDNENRVIVTQNSASSSSGLELDRVEDKEVLDFIDDDDEDDEDVGEYGRKRMRKPVKARSLKSLM